MSFDPNTQDFDTYLQTAIQQGVAAAMVGQPPTTPVPGAVPAATPAAVPGAVPTVTSAPGGVTLMVDGQPYTFQNAEEASAAVQETLNQHRTANQAQAAQTPPATPAQPDAKPTFDQTRYISLMGNDPVAAADYIAGFTEVGKDDRVQALEEKIQTNDRMMAAYQFKENHPEFAFMQNGANVIETTLKANKWDFNPANLEAALAIAQNRGQLPTRDQVQQQLNVNATAQNQTAVNAQAGAVLPTLPSPAPPAQPGQIPPQVPVQSVVAPATPPVPTAAVPPPPAPGAGPPHLNPAMGPNPTYPPVAMPPGMLPSAVPGVPPLGEVVMPPPAFGIPTAAGIPANWVEQAENLSTEQIEQIFRQQNQ